MKLLLLLFISVFISVVYGESCRGKFNEALFGECAAVEKCSGTLLAGESCENRRCCLNKTSAPSTANCFNKTVFISIYNSTRGRYLADVLNYGMSRAGICSNCQAQAAFLAIAATMTQNFQKDEATGSESFFANDDRKYGNNQTRDGSRFRRRGFFGLRGRTMYERLQVLEPKYKSMSSPENVAVLENSIEIAALLWEKPTLQNVKPLTPYSDGTFYSFSQLWFILTGGIEELPYAAKQYSKFLRLLQCGGDLYPGQGTACVYNSTHPGVCVPDCIKGLEDAGEFCGCSGAKGQQCANGPPHIRCCLGSCSQELKLDLGIVSDASGSIGSANYELQRSFTKDLLRQVNVGQNKTHVGIINFSTKVQTVTGLNNDYELNQKLQKVDTAIYYSQNTYTYDGLDQAGVVFSYANGRRRLEEGAVPVIFVITDGASANELKTIQAAERLKRNNIHIVSVGIGNNLKLSELHAMCTPPASDNYFAISNYTALQQKLNQFLSKTCSEPAVVPPNRTVTGEVTAGKYAFFKIEIIVKGNKVMIKIKLFNGKVKLFYSFKTRNPKDPADFEDYESSNKGASQSLLTEGIHDVEKKFSAVKAKNDLVTLVIDKPEQDIGFVYVGVKGVEKTNKFEINLEDCAVVNCQSAASSLITRSNTVWVLLFVVIVLKLFQ